MADQDYCFTALSPMEKIQCGNWLRGGIDGIIVFATNAVIEDYTVLANWTALISAGTAVKIENVKGTINDPSVVEGENPIGCGTDNVVDGGDYQVDIMDFNVNATNDLRYAQINGGIYYIAIHTCEGQLLIVEAPVTANTPQANVPTSNKEKQRYATNYKWSGTTDFAYIRITSPAGLF
jgi:hypothetical protein